MKFTKLLAKSALGICLSLSVVVPAFAQSSEVVGVQQSFLRAGEPNPSPQEIKEFVGFWNPYEPGKAVAIISVYLKARAFGVDVGCFKKVYRPGMPPQAVVESCKK